MDNVNPNENINENTKNKEEKTLGNLIEEPSTKTTDVNNDETTLKSEIENSSNEFNKLLDKIMNSNLSKEQKVKVLLGFRDDINRPSKGEIQNLMKLEQMYGQSQMQQQKQVSPEYNPQLLYSSQQMPYYSPYYSNQQPNLNMMMQPQPHMQPQVQQQPTFYQPQSQPQQIVSNYQFEILKNKLDTIQLEMIDIVRHLKDYSKRYMAAVREDDMTKLDSYVRDLINVDKEVKKAQEAIDEERETREEIMEQEPEEEQSVIGRATSGMKNFVSGLGKNIGSVTDLVKNTTNATNNFLKKNIIDVKEEETQKNNSKDNNNKNIVSINDYVNENKANTNTNINTVIPEQKEEQKEEPQSTPPPPPPSKNESSNNLEKEIKKINVEIKNEINKNLGIQKNEDINTKNNININTKKNNTTNINQKGGSRCKYKNKNIKNKLNKRTKKQKNNKNKMNKKKSKKANK